VKPAVAWIALLALAGCGVRGPTVDDAEEPRRIVSMAPSVTESLFALGLGDRVVGVTRFCDYPAPARRLPKVGGYLDPSYEAIVSLRPDLVVLMQSHGDVERRLHGLGIATLRTDQERLDGVLASIRLIAERCGVPDRGRRLVGDISARLARVLAAVADRRPVRTLVSVGRPAARGAVTSVWAAGPGTFYSDALRIAGGVNVVEAVGVTYPEIGREGMLALDPDVVVEVLPGTGAAAVAPATVLDEWAAFGALPAVASGRVEVLAGDAYVRPGPRIVELVEAMAATLHPEITPRSGE